MEVYVLPSRFPFCSPPRNILTFLLNHHIPTPRSPQTDINQVTGEAQGEQSSLSQFVQHLNSGPPASRVSKVEQSDIATKEGEKGFSQ